jgi:hypothetical protein
LAHLGSSPMVVGPTTSASSEDGTFEGEIWGLKTIFYYKNHSRGEKRSIQSVLRPRVAALDALDTPGDGAAAPTR